VPEKFGLSAANVLKLNRNAAIEAARGVGVARMREVLQKAAQQLEHRLPPAQGRAGQEPFTPVRMRATLKQVQAVTADLVVGMQGALLEQGDVAATRAAEDALEYMQKAERDYSGIAGARLPITEAMMLDAGKMGARASLLRRIATSGTDEGVEGDKEHRGRQGVLVRYGVETIGAFEEVLQQGVLQGKPWEDMRGELVDASPFLQGKPKHCAERIARTEVMGAYNLASHEGMVAANTKLGDLCKILCATVDWRTGWDSLLIHGQIRRVDEPFDYVDGEQFMHPPNRPNDREVPVPHRASWPVPPELEPLPLEVAQERWTQQKRKGAMPERPLVSTLDLEEHAEEKLPEGKTEEEQPAQEQVPQEEQRPQAELEPSERPDFGEEDEEPEIVQEEQREQSELDPSERPDFTKFYEAEAKLAEPAPPPKPKKLTKLQKLEAAKAKADAAIKLLDALPPSGLGYVELPPEIAPIIEYDKATAAEYFQLLNDKDLLASAEADFSKTKKVTIGGVVTVESVAKKVFVSDKLEDISKSVVSNMLPSQGPIVIHKFKGEHVLPIDGNIEQLVTSHLMGEEKVEVQLIDLDAAIKAKGKKPKITPVAPAVSAPAPAPALPPGTSREEYIKLAMSKLASMPQENGSPYSSPQAPAAPSYGPVPPSKAPTFKQGIEDLREHVYANEKTVPSTRDRYHKDSSKVAMEVKPSMSESVNRFSCGYDYTIRMVERGKQTEAEMLQAIRSHGSYPAYGGTPEKHLEQAREASQNFTEMFGNHRIPKTEGIVYRGIGRLNEQAMASFINKDEMQFQATTSTSITAAVSAERFMPDGGKAAPYRVLMKLKQKSGVAIRALSSFGSEDEVLMAKGSTFKITGRRKFGDNVLLIEGEEV